MKGDNYIKRTLIFVLSLCIYSVISCSCNRLHQMGGETVTRQDETGSDTSVVVESPPDCRTYSFDSYQEIEQALTQKNSNEYSVLREEQINCGKVYQNTLIKFASGDIKLAVPQINGSPISLRNREGFSNISLFTSELYNLPWLWYHCVVDDQNLDVKISYLDVIEGLEINANTTYMDILQLIAPDAPSPENYEKYESYKTIYEKKVILKDGVTVTAMVLEVKDNSKVYVEFVYDGLLVTLYGDRGLFTDAFWPSFDIAYDLSKS